MGVKTRDFCTYDVAVSYAIGMEGCPITCTTYVQKHAYTSLSGGTPLAFKETTGERTKSPKAVVTQKA